MEHRAILATYNQVYNNSSTEIINEVTVLKSNSGIEKMFTSDRTSFSLGSKTFFADNNSVQITLTPQNIKKYLTRQQQIKLDVLKKDNYNVTSLLVYNNYSNSIYRNAIFKKIKTPYILPYYSNSQAIFLGTDGEGKNFALHQNKLYREDGSLVKRDPAKKVNTESVPVEIFLTFTKGKHKVNPDGSLTLGDLYVGNTRGKRLITGEVVKLNKIPNDIKIQQVNTLELGEFADFKNIVNLPSIVKKLRMYPSYKNIILPHMPGLKNMSILEEVSIRGNTKDNLSRCEFNQFKDLNVNLECALKLMYLKILNFEGIKSFKDIIIESCLIKSFNGLSSCDGANIVLSIFQDPEKRPPSLEGLPSTVNNFILDFETDLFKYPESPVNSDFLNGFPNLVEKDFFITKRVFESLSNNFKEIGLSDIVQGDIVILDEIYFWHQGGIEAWAGNQKARVNSDINGRPRILNRFERLKYSKTFTDTLNKGKAEDDWQF